MKVVFCSNFLNNHQEPFCNKMYEILGNDFYFVETVPMQEVRLSLGFSGCADKYPYTIMTYRSQEEHQRAIDLCNEADVVIIGSASEEFITERLNKNKLTFRACERYFKRGKWILLYPPMLISKFKKDIRYRNKNLYMLCASAFTASDCRFIKCYLNKTYKWGYFPTVEKCDFNELKRLKNNNKIRLLWVARFIRLKHPEAPIFITKKLLENGYDVELEMIGVGPLEAKCKKLVQNLGIQNNVFFTGALSISDVLGEMKKSNIFLFTSNKREGWGAVINESMSCGCAVVASDAIGSVPYLIKNGENGFHYKDGSLDDLYSKVEILINDPGLREKMGHMALETINGLWSAENATQRLVKLFDSMLCNNPIEFEDGPCSRAE